jgi:hypothetical protein
MRWLRPDRGSLASAVTRASYGTLVAVDQRSDEVRSLLMQAIADLAAVPPDDQLLAADRLVAMATWAWAGDDDALARAAAEAASGLAPLLHDELLELALPAIRGLLELWTDRDVAHANALVVLAANERRDNSFWSLVACAVLSIEALVDGDGEAGLRWTDEILARYERLGTRSIADTLETRGNHYVNASRFADAVRCYGAAQYQNVRIGRRWPRHPPTAAKLTVAKESLPHDEFDSAWASGQRLGATNLVRDWL